MLSPTPIYADLTTCADFEVRLGDKTAVKTRAFFAAKTTAQQIAKAKNWHVSAQHAVIRMVIAD